MDVGHRNRLRPHQHLEHRHRSLGAERHRRHRRSLDVVRHLDDLGRRLGVDHERHPLDVGHLGGRHLPLGAVRMGCFLPDGPLGEECPCPGWQQTGCCLGEECRQVQLELLVPQRQVRRLVSQLPERLVQLVKLEPESKPPEQQVLG